MKYQLVHLKKLMKENGIKGSSVMLKQEMIDVLKEKQLLPPSPEVEVEAKPPIKPQYEYVRTIAKNRRPVTVRNIETGEITSYPSLCRAARSLHKYPCSITFFNGKIIDGKYYITVHEPKLKIV